LNAVFKNGLVLICVSTIANVKKIANWLDNNQSKVIDSIGARKGSKMSFHQLHSESKIRIDPTKIEQLRNNEIVFIIATADSVQQGTNYSP
jgi:hypothetical protein